MKYFLGNDKTLPLLEIFSKAVAKLRHELPTDIEIESTSPMELLTLAEDIRAKT